MPSKAEKANPPPFWYVENRRFPIPAVLRRVRIKDAPFGDAKSVRVDALMDLFRRRDEQAWMKDHRLHGKCVPIYAAALYKFCRDANGPMPSRDAAFETRYVRSAENSYVDAPMHYAEALQISCNEQARRFFAELLPQLSNMHGWQLGALSCQIHVETPLAVLTVAFVPSPQMNLSELNATCNSINDAVSKLWPLFYLLLISLGCAARKRECNDASCRKAWETTSHPFLLPKILFKDEYASSVFDVSERYQYQSWFFISGPDQDVTNFVNKSNVSLPDHCDKDKGEPWHAKLPSLSLGSVDVLMGHRGLSILVQSLQFPDHEGLGGLADFTMELSLASDLTFYCYYINSIFTNLLHCHIRHHDSWDATSIRALAYQSAVSLTLFDERALCQFERTRIVFDHMLRDLQFSEAAECLRNSRELILSLAQGIEANVSARKQTILSVVAAAIGVLGLITVGIAVYDFVIGSRQSPPDEPTELRIRSLEGLFAFACLLLLVLLGTLLFPSRRRS
jgi:hypothetical protein